MHTARANSICFQIQIVLSPSFGLSPLHKAFTQLLVTGSGSQGKLQSTVALPRWLGNPSLNQDKCISFHSLSAQASRARAVDVDFTGLHAIPGSTYQTADNKCMLSGVGLCCFLNIRFSKGSVIPTPPEPNPSP